MNSRSKRYGEGLNRFRDLPADPSRGDPLYQYGAQNSYRIGSYWTQEVEVPLEDLLRSVPRPVVQDKHRLASIREARMNNVVLPPIEIAVFKNGSGWIVDGNHRLVDAKQAGLKTISVVFSFVGL